MKAFTRRWCYLRRAGAPSYCTRRLARERPTQAIFGTRATLGELGDVVQRANTFGYVGLKTKHAPCGGYQAYIAGFSSPSDAVDYARVASQRTGLHVIVVKA